MDREDAIRFFQQKGEKYKAELIQDLPRGETISLYTQGDWVDLCRGPHMRSTADVGQAFKLMKTAGAYWRGDHRNAMLSRIYGTAWRDQKELDAYLHQLEEAERRDHRRIGKEMDLFHLQEEAPGAVFWHPNGWKLYRTAEAYMRRRLDAAGYQEVRTPLVLRPRLLGAVRPLGEIPPEHVLRHGGTRRGQDPRGQADELPLPHPDLPAGRAVLSRTAAAAGGIRLLPPLRAVRRAARHHAGPRLSPRTTRTSSARRRQIATRNGPLRRAAVLDLPRFRLPGVPGEVLRSARRSGWAPTRYGTRRRRRCARPARTAGRGVHAEPRRGRVLRPQAGVRAARRDRPRLAVRHAAGRFHDAGTTGRGVRRRGRQPPRLP